MQKENIIKTVDLSFGLGFLFRIIALQPRNFFHFIFGFNARFPFQLLHSNGLIGLLAWLAACLPASIR